MPAILTSRTTQTPGENRNSEIFTVAGVFLALPALALVARFKSKRILRRAFQIDDYLLIWAFVSQSPSLAPASTHQVIGPPCWRIRFLHLGYSFKESCGRLLTDSL